MKNIEHPARKHAYTTTLSKVNIFSPKSFQACEVRLLDIVAGLSKICRFNGQIDRFYSVAEHSVLVSQIALHLGDPEAALPALFHDAHEAYCGDLPTPQKDMIPGWRDFEAGYEFHTRVALGLPVQAADVWRRVRIYDTMILHREIHNLRANPPKWYDPEQERAVPNAIQPVGLAWDSASELFYHHMAKLNYVPEGILARGLTF